LLAPDARKRVISKRPRRGREQALGLGLSRHAITRLANRSAVTVPESPVKPPPHCAASANVVKRQ
jgi:hypothetical protein